MTVGVPVVASNQGALPEVIGDAGLLVAPTNIEAIAAAIERVLDDHELARAMVARGLARATAYDWRSSAVALREAYRRAVEAWRGRGTH
jgi:glycosyltransferase involved in cell wall biosynthesis